MTCWSFSTSVADLFVVDCASDIDGADGLVIRSRLCAGSGMTRESERSGCCWRASVDSQVSKVSVPSPWPGLSSRDADRRLRAKSLLLLCIDECPSEGRWSVTICKYFRPVVLTFCTTPSAGTKVSLIPLPPAPPPLNFPVRMPGIPVPFPGQPSSDPTFSTRPAFLPAARW
ncbi:hypothetical protein BC567DRAFT_228455 [Phyllosticta citribraziliensis]